MLRLFKDKYENTDSKDMVKDGKQWENMAWQ